MVRLLHRRLAWIGGLVAIAWAMTGFLHPVLGWTAPRPAVQTPPVQTLDLEGVVAPAPALSAAGVTNAALVRLVMVDGAPFWFADLRPGETARMVIDARTGVPAPGIEARHAEVLARHFAGLPDAPVESVELVQRFDLFYPTINRFLPVWEVRFDVPGGLAVFVEPGLDRLAMVTDDRRRVLLAVFQSVHTLSFLGSAETLRLIVLTLLVGTVLATAIAGALMLLRGKGRGLGALHRIAGALVLVPIIMFSLSGLLHLWVTTTLRAEPAPRAASFAIAALPALPLVEAGLTVNELTATAAPDGQVAWRLLIQETGHWFAANPAGGAPVDDAARARALADALPEATVTPVTRFGGDYGFTARRLPVLRVETADGPVFVDVREGLVALAPRPGPIDRIEAWVFDTLHKWEFADPLVGRVGRDAATMAATFAITMTALAGLMLAFRRRRRRR